MPNGRRIPMYRLHRPTGQAVVRLEGRDHYLGSHGTPESRKRYDRLIAEWLTRSTSPPATGDQFSTAASPAATIDEVVLAFWTHAETHYRDPQGSPTAELGNLRDAIRPLRRLYGGTKAAEFGPLALRAVREELVRSGLARSTVNARINRIRRIFRWAASVELVPPSVSQALQTVTGLQRGRTTAPEPPAIRPVALEHVQATLPELPVPVAAMVQVQLLCGCRTEEVLSMRRAELRTDVQPWEYRPTSHKNSWRGQERVIFLGPQCQQILAAFLVSGRPDEFLFRPGCRPAPPSKRKKSVDNRRNATRQSDRYDRRSYRQAIVRASQRSGIPPWTPLQLRHTAATTIRERFGVEAAQVILGHSRVETTEIYAEKSLNTARRTARRIITELG